MERYAQTMGSIVMKPRIETWAIVITGQWNPDILSAFWVRKNLLPEEHGNELEMQLGIGPGLRSSIRLIGESVILVPTRGRVELRPRECSDDCLGKVEEVALKVIELLPHTPVTGYGVNFGFSEERKDTFDYDIFNASDYVKLQGADLRPVQRRVTRNLKFEKGSNLNITFTQNGEEDGFKIDINIHHPVEPNTDMCAFAREMKNKTVRYKGRVLDILQSIYGLQLEEETDADD